MCGSQPGSLLEAQKRKAEVDGGLGSPSRSRRHHAFDVGAEHRGEVLRGAPWRPPAEALNASSMNVVNYKMMMNLGQAPWVASHQLLYAAPPLQAHPPLPQEQQGQVQPQQQQIGRPMPPLYTPAAPVVQPLFRDAYVKAVRNLMESDEVDVYSVTLSSGSNSNGAPGFRCATMHWMSPANEMRSVCLGLQATQPSAHAAAVSAASEQPEGSHGTHMLMQLLDFVETQCAMFGLLQPFQHPGASHPYHSSPLLHSTMAVDPTDGVDDKDPHPQVEGEPDTQQQHPQAGNNKLNLKGPRLISLTMDGLPSKQIKMALPESHVPCFGRVLFQMTVHQFADESSMPHTLLRACVQAMEWYYKLTKLSAAGMLVGVRLSPAAVTSLNEISTESTHIWNAHYTVLEWVHVHFGDIHKALQQVPSLRATWERSVLHQKQFQLLWQLLLGSMKMISVIAKASQVEKMPSSNRVLAWMAKTISCNRAVPYNDRYPPKIVDVFNAFASRGRAYLWNESDAAVYTELKHAMDPTTAVSKMCGAALLDVKRRDDTVMYVRDMMRNVPGPWAAPPTAQEDQNNQTMSADGAEGAVGEDVPFRATCPQISAFTVAMSVLEPLAKTWCPRAWRRTAADADADADATAVDAVARAALEDEVSRHLRREDRNVHGKEVRVDEYWVFYQDQFPLLSALARALLTIVTTEAPSQRLIARTAHVLANAKLNHHGQAEPTPAPAPAQQQGEPYRYAAAGGLLDSLVLRTTSEKLVMEEVSRLLLAEGLGPVEVDQVMRHQILAAKTAAVLVPQNQMDKNVIQNQKQQVELEVEPHRDGDRDDMTVTVEERQQNVNLKAEADLKSPQPVAGTHEQADLTNFDGMMPGGLDPNRVQLPVVPTNVLEIPPTLLHLLTTPDPSHEM